MRPPPRQEQQLQDVNPPCRPKSGTQGTLVLKMLRSCSPFLALRSHLPGLSVPICEVGAELESLWGVLLFPKAFLQKVAGTAPQKQNSVAFESPPGHQLDVDPPQLVCCAFIMKKIHEGCNAED